MALSATFTANFSSFYDAVDKAEIKLKEFGAGAENAGKRLSAMGNQFSGVKIIQDATLMVKAIEDIGGTTKLTEKELAKLGSTANEAVAKMKALGMDVPKNLQKIADETKNANKAGIDWMGSLTKIAGAVGIAFSVDAVVDFVGSILEGASAVKDFSSQWGVSTKAVQQWTAAAKGSGVEAQTLGGSIQYMTAQMAEGSDKYRISVEQLGIEYDKFKKLSIEDQYRTLMDAVKGIKDETLLLDVATGLWGPNAKKMIGLVKEGWMEAAEKQKFYADDTINKMAEVDAKLKAFKDNAKIAAVEIAEAGVSGLQKWMTKWDGFFTYVAAGLSDVMGGGRLLPLLITQQRAVSGLTQGTENLVDQMLNLGHATTGTNKPLKTQAEIDAELAAKKAAAAKAAQAQAQAQEKLRQETEALIKTWRAEDEKLNDLIDSFGGTGSGAIGKAEQYMRAVHMAIPIEQMSIKAKQDIHKVLDEAIVSYEAAGQRAPEEMYKIWLATKNATEGVIEFSSKWKNFADIVNTQPINLGAGFALSLPPPKPGIFAGFAEGAMASMAEAMMKAIQGGGNVFAAASSTLVAYMLDPKQSEMGKALKTQIDKLPKEIASTINGVLPLIGPLIAPALQKLGDKIASFFGASESQKLRRALIDAAGGVKELGREAQKAGVSLDGLFRARNTSQVEAEMRKIQEAIALQATAFDEVMAAAGRYGITLEELGPAMQRQQLDQQAQQLFRDWEILNAAGLDTVVITENMAEAVNAYVRQAAQMGIEVPAAMRPMLEAMVRAGQLTDENGVAFEDLEDAGVSFAMSMSDGFKALIEEVKKLTEAIGRGLSQSIENLPPVPVAYGGLAGVVAGQLPQPQNSFAQGSGGFRDFGSGTPAILHGVEAVVPIGQAGGLGGGMMTVIVEADGRQISRIVAPYLPGEVRRLGLARG